MKRKYDKHSDLFNEFIKEINNNNHPKKLKSDKANNKNFNNNNKELFEYENKDDELEDIYSNKEDNKEED